MINLKKYDILKEKTYFKKLGKVVKIVGLTIESVGPDAKLNDLCMIISGDEDEHAIMAEVVGFRDNRVLLMPYDNVEGVEEVNETFEESTEEIECDGSMDETSDEVNNGTSFEHAEDG